MSDGSPAPERLARAARAAHDLSDALWETLHEELAGAPQAQRTQDLAQRLADVCSTIALLAAAPEPPVLPESPLEPPVPSPEEGIEIHDTRAEEPSAWIVSIGR